MAVDSRDKRFSLLGFGAGNSIRAVFPNPDGSNADDSFERAHWLYLYAGLNIQSGQPTEMRWGGVPWMNHNNPAFSRSW